MTGRFDVLSGNDQHDRKKKKCNKEVPKHYFVIVRFFVCVLLGTYFLWWSWMVTVFAFFSPRGVKNLMPVVMGSYYTYCTSLKYFSTNNLRVFG